MPLGFERINERTKRPNELINFIRPIAGLEEALSRDFLERIAAQAYPVMKSNYLSVMALEEYPSNPEFAGRNFNAGEVIQLVLKSRNGHWLPFRHVQMVMMHELAHCKQMNHSRDFWRVRDAYADEMRGLWERNYCGEGLWGNGRGLEGDYLRNGMPDASAMPGALCGGTYRGRGKRKAGGRPKPKQTYAERQQRRIVKKFGSGGAAVGTDEATRKELERGKNVKGKPRVAGSARGRDLRAAAALARLEQAKVEPEPDVISSDIESEFSWSESETEGDTATDLNGKKLHDLKGQDLVRVCGEVSVMVLTTCSLRP
jgi:DNA-dependent metalloprotease WSS1